MVLNKWVALFAIAVVAVATVHAADSGRRRPELAVRKDLGMQNSENEEQKTNAICFFNRLAIVRRDINRTIRASNIVGIKQLLNELPPEEKSAVTSIVPALRSLVPPKTSFEHMPDTLESFGFSKDVDQACWSAMLCPRLELATGMSADEIQLFDKALDNTVDVPGQVDANAAAPLYVSMLRFLVKLKAVKEAQVEAVKGLNATRLEKFFKASTQEEMSAAKLIFEKPAPLRLFRDQSLEDLEYEHKELGFGQAVDRAYLLALTGPRMKIAKEMGEDEIRIFLNHLHSKAFADQQSAVDDSVCSKVISVASCCCGVCSSNTCFGFVQKLLGCLHRPDEITSCEKKV